MRPNYEDFECEIREAEIIIRFSPTLSEFRFYIVESGVSFASERHGGTGDTGRYDQVELRLASSLIAKNCYGAIIS